jgi:hypothetical protein
MLLKIKATIKRINTPLSTGVITYQYPMFFISSEPAIKAVAPQEDVVFLSIALKQ